MASRKSANTAARARKATAARSPQRAKTAFRLRPDIRPERYGLELELDPQRSKSYRGRVRIELALARATSVIELHAVDLRLGGARIESAGRTLRARVEPVPEHESVRVTCAAEIAAGKAVLELSFRGRLRSDLRGLYFAQSGKRRYAFSQLEAADARRFFPCFDEPAFKARFGVEVVTDAHNAVLSNASEQSRVRQPGGKVRVRFADTPKLSTYLVALAVGDLRKSRALYAGRTPIRIWHVPGQERLTAFAQDAARECLLRLSRYFAVPYPYDKLDLVAVPDFDMGAMENAGAVFFRETLLLVDPRRATLPEKKRALEVICHELAHMWYGNLVTMAWWDDLWLNEAFATWMAFDVVAAWRPELRMWNDFGHSRDSALELDALEHTHPIYTQVRTPDEATENFDLITYEKGAAVIRMLERYLGPARFRRGVQQYIARHREQNAVAADLWRALERQAGEQVEKVVRPWVERAGFPLLRVTREGPGRRTLLLEQERFSARGPGAPRGARREPPWPVPVVLAIGAGRKRLERRLLLGKRQRVALPPATRFVYANADEGGFYRPLHDARSLRELCANLAQLDAAERLGLVTHTWALVAAGYDELPSFLDLFGAFGAEPDPDVLAALQPPLLHVLDRIAGEGEHAALRRRIGAVFAPALRAAGWSARAREPEHERLRRAELLSLCCLIGEDEVAVREAQRHCMRYLRSPRSLEPNLVGPVVVAAARAGDAALHARFLSLSSGGAASTPQERRRFRMALCEFRDRACIDRTLSLCLGDRIPKQDLPLVLARLLENPAARERTWSFMQRRWTELGRRISPQLVSRLIDALPALQGERRRREVMAFFERHPVPTAQRALRQADERFRLDLALRRRASRSLADWLSTQQI